MTQWYTKSSAQALQELDTNSSRGLTSTQADQGQDGRARADDRVDVYAVLRAQPAGQAVDVRVGRAALHNYDHCGVFLSVYLKI